MVKLLKRDLANPDTYHLALPHSGVPVHLACEIPLPEGLNSNNIPSPEHGLLGHI